MGIIHSMHTFATSNPCNPFALKDRDFCACCFAALKKQSKKEYLKKKTEEWSGARRKAFECSQSLPMHLYETVSGKDQRKCSKTFSE